MYSATADDILRTVVVPFMRRNNRFDFQQDNARPDTACLSVNFLQAYNVNKLPWPSLSPDLAPIEHVWDMLNRRYRGNHLPFNSFPELEYVIIIEWNAMPQYKIKQITRGIQKRCRATIIANGAWTRYWHCGFLCEFTMCHVLHSVNPEVREWRCLVRSCCSFLLLLFVSRIYVLICNEI